MNIANEIRAQAKSLRQQAEAMDTFGFHHICDSLRKEFRESFENRAKAMDLLADRVEALESRCEHDGRERVLDTDEIVELDREQDRLKAKVEALETAVPAPSTSADRIGSGTPLST